MGNQATQARLRLRQADEERRRQLELLLGERGPLVRGSLGERARACGVAGCRCVREGRLHKSAFLSVKVSGQTRQVHVPATDEAKVEEGVERYRRYRAGKRRLAELGRRQLELVDALGVALLLRYPADDPVPAPKKRGRVPGAQDHRGR